MEGKVNPIDRLSIMGSYMYQTSEDEDGNEDVMFTPNNMVKLGASLSLPCGVNISPFYTFFGESFPNPTNSAPIMRQDNPEINSIHMVNLALSYKFPGALNAKVQVTVQNMIDDEYHFTEFSKGWENTSPIYPGRAIFTDLIVNF